MICPTELQKLTNVLNALDEDELAKIQPLFITTDPERDSPEVLKEFLSDFHPKITGLTGTMEQTEAVKSAYKVYAAKVQDPNMAEYTMDHSTHMYIMGPDGEFLDIYGSDEQPDEIVKDIRDRL